MLLKAANATTTEVTIFRKIVIFGLCLKNARGAFGENGGIKYYYCVHNHRWIP